MGLLSNRVAKGSLKPGDHIYSWRTAYIYAHHGGVLYRFEYSVNPALFLAKARGGTCTLAVSDSDDIVVHRAKYLLENGFGCYCIFKSNCEDFAIYCKTGLLVIDQRTLGQSGQAASIIGGPLAAVLATPLRLVTTNLYGMVAVGIGVYCASRYSTDIGKRMDVVKVSVEDMTRRLAAGSLQVVEAQISAPLLQAPESQISAPLLQAPESQIPAPLLQAPESQISAPPTRGSSNLFFWSRSPSNLVTR